MDHLTKVLHHWLAKNDLPSDGVKIVLEFPDRDSACRAEMCIKQELEPMIAYHAIGQFGVVEKMNGLGLSLTYKGQR